MNRRSSSVRIEKFCLVEYLGDHEKAVYRSDLLEFETKLIVGSACQAPFKGQLYSAVVIAMNGKFFVSLYYNKQAD